MSQTVPFTTYDEAGRVLGFGVATNPLEQAGDAGGVFIGGQINGDFCYFVDGYPIARPDPEGFALSADEVVADGEASIDLTGVPAGAQVWFAGEISDAPGGAIALTTTRLGINVVRVEAFPMKPWQASFVGVEPIPPIE